MTASSAIDLAYLEAQCAGDGALLRELAGLFADQIERLTPVIATMGASDQRADAAHTLRGAAQAVGADALAAVLETIEHDLRANREPVLAALAAQAAAALQHARRLSIPA